MFNECRLKRNNELPKLTSEQLIELAKKYPPSREWFQEEITKEELFGEKPIRN